MHRIWFGAAVFWLALSASALAQTPSGLTNFSQRPAVTPTRETTFGVETDDPYRWMEADERREEMSAWVRAASAHTIAELAALPGRERIANRLQTISRSGVSYSGLQLAGERLFFLRLDTDASVPKLVVRERNGSERVLFDPARTDGAPQAINNFTPSPSGRRIAFHVAEGGGEVGVMRFMDVATGAMLPDELSPIWGEFDVSWINENTVIYTRMAVPPGEDPIQGMDVRLHRLGTPTEQDTVLIAPGGVVEPFEFPGAYDSPVSPWTSGYAAGARADYRALFARDADVAAGRPNWIAVATYDDQVTWGDVRGDYAYFITTRNAPNGEIIRVDLRNPSLANATSVLPASNLILTELYATRDGIYVVAMENGVSRLFFLRNGSAPARIVQLPFDGTLEEAAHSASGAGITFGLTGWIQNTRYYEVRGGRVRALGVEAETYAGVSAFEVVNDAAQSADGTSVPITILSRRGIARNSENPTILYAYGSYGVTDTPGYAPNIYAWLEEGGVFAFCHTRGGGLRGRAWHEGGREANKPNAHADYIACAERLIQLNYTRPARLGGTGVSAGGLLVPVAALKRPELFAAIVPRVAALNPTRLSVADNGVNQYAEMGDARTEAGYRALYEQDSYHWLARASGSPHWLMTVGLNDNRVSPWETAKFAARALARFGDQRLVLIRTDPEAGHGIGSTRDQITEERADIYAFFMNRFGMPDFQPAR